jgi:hypothetical protein
MIVGPTALYSISSMAHPGINPEDAYLPDF